jgi:hypothetical protein
MTTRHHALAAVAAALILAAIGVHAQQSPAAQPSPTTNGAPTTPPPKILVAGENPAITLRDKEGGPALTSVNFWRVHWSPVGSGAVCFVTVSNQGSGDLRIAVHDNPKVLDYVTRDLMSSLMASFKTPPFTPVRGTITKGGVTVTERTESCKSDTHNVVLTWRGVLEPTWVDIRPGATVLMTFTMVMAKDAEVIINGKKAPGRVVPGGRGSFPPSFLALTETWRR